MVVQLGKLWGKEFVGGELNLLEQRTGVFGGALAFLVGHAEVVGRNHNLHHTLKLHNGKQAKGNVDGLGTGHTAKFAAETAANTGRQIADRVIVQDIR